MSDFVKQLNDSVKIHRLSAMASLAEAEKNGLLVPPTPGAYVNNHIHTTYSFSPYSPTAAVWYARAAGLQTAGIMDHDSVGGVPEFLTAAGMVHMPVTCGFEVRIHLGDCPFADRRVNNPDQNGVAYVACHGIPRNRTAQAEAFLFPYRQQRNLRNRKMVDNLNKLLEPADLAIDFEKDVVPLSNSADTGSITERHLLFAVSKALVSRFGRDGSVLSFLSDKLGLTCSQKVCAQLSDRANPYYEYDLLGLLKGNLVEKFYIPATDELPTADAFIAFVKSIGAIAAYAYLGDVGNSVTGDKKAQKFEDDYLDELFGWLKLTGFDAVTYMPSRNTPEQLNRVMALCEQYNFLQISGEDINSPRQSFICPALSKPEFAHLFEATWALIGHELSATANSADGICSIQSARDFPKMADRVKEFARRGHELSGK